MSTCKNIRALVRRGLALVLSLAIALPLWGCEAEETVSSTTPSTKPRETLTVTPSATEDTAVYLDETYDFPDLYDYFSEETVQTVLKFAKDNGLQLTDWRPELIDLLDKNPETLNYVLYYPFNKDKEYEIDLSEYVGSETMPLLLQWDERWGYEEYAGEFMSISGCGPTTLSMVCIYLLDDPKYTPLYIAKFAEDNGYGVKGNGSSWTLISQGGKQLGLDVTEIPLDENRIIRNLNAGNPIIIVVGPGLFTTTGHFLVMTGYEDGYVTVNDPNSPRKTAQKWLLTDVMKDIKNLWVCR